MSPVRAGRRTAVTAAAALSLLGLAVHNVADLPGQTVVSPETALPAVVLAGLVALDLRRPGPATAALLLAWAGLHLVGGAVLSVLPVPWWPFDPEQSGRHYAFHVLYGLAQLPLLITARRLVRRKDTAPV